MMKRIAPLTKTLFVAHRWKPARHPALCFAILLFTFLPGLGACAEELSFTKPLAPGVLLKQTLHKRTPDPLIINVLEVDPSTPGLRIECVPGKGQNGRRETVSSITARTGCLAGVNASFFSTTGDTIGLAISNGELVSSPYPNRVCVGWTADRKVLVDWVTMTASARLGDTSMPIAGINRARKRGELVVYTQHYGPTTLTDAAGSEAVLTGLQFPLRTGETSGVVSLVRTYAGRCPIPPDGIVLSGSGAASDFIRGLKPGDKVDLSITLRGSNGTSWNEVTDAVCGGPYVVKDGRVYVDLAAEGFAPSFGAVRHPRTLLGITRNGKLLIVTIDGRQTISAGITLQEAARLMLNLGAVTAVNLDGGGSTTLAVRGMVLNSPSGGKERPVTTAIAVRSPEGQPQPPPQISIEPASAVVTSDSTALFTLRAADASGSTVELDPKEVLWGVKGGVGFVSQSGEFTGIKAGTGTVQAWARGATASAAVTVTPGKPVSLTAKATLDPQDPDRVRVTVTVLDANANPVPAATVTFSPGQGGQAVPAEIQTGSDGTAWADVCWTSGSGPRTVVVAGPGLAPVTVTVARTRG